MIGNPAPRCSEMPPADRQWGCAVHRVELPGLAHASGPVGTRVLAMLCASERARMATIRSARSAWEYACSHAALRLVVGRRLGIAPAELPLADPGEAFVAPRLQTARDGSGGFHGRICNGGRDAEGMHLSLSHSAPDAAIAIGWHTRIGIDVEQAAQAQTAFESRSLYMSTAELQQLDALPSVERHLQALRVWCMKEAALKATGQGLAIDPRQVSLQRAGPDRNERLAVFGDGRPLLKVGLLAAGSDASTVLAVARDVPAATPVVTRERLVALLA